MGDTTTAATGGTETVRSPGGQHRRKNVSQRATEVSIKSMLLKGISNRNIASFLGISPTTVQRVRNDIKSVEGEGDLKSSLMSPHLGKMSVAVVEHFLKKGAKLKTVKGSDAIAAVKEVASRQWPTRQEHGPTTFNFANINLNMFLPDPRPEAMDVTPTTTYGVEGGGKNE